MVSSQSSKHPGWSPKTFDQLLKGVFSLTPIGWKLTEIG
jgi:hypothetical protein